MRLSLFVALSALFPALLLTGCTLKTTAPALQAGGAAIKGGGHGGQQPIVGAHIYLMAANTTGYGAAATSLLDSNATGHADSIGAYVLSGPGGIFSITGDYSCSASQQVYLLAVGGDAGAGENPAAALMSVLGQCPSGSTNFLSTEPFIMVNEVTTVAGAYALSGYMTDMLHVSSSGTALANTGMANAFLTAAELVDISSGVAYATTPAGNGVVPQSKINTLANILSTCVNSNGAISSTPVPTTCYALFSNATSDGTASGTQPTETVTAALNMAHNPGANVANLYSLAPGTAAPFQPSVSSMSDLTLALRLTGGGLGHPAGLAVDGYGNVWTANGTTGTGGNASKFAAGTGAALSPAGTGYTGGGLFLPYSIAIDGSNNVWIGDASSGGTVADAHVTKLGEDGTPMSATGYNLGTVGGILSIGIDNLGNAIVAPEGSAYKVDGSTGAVTALATNNSVTSFSLATAPNGATWIGTSGTSPGVNELDGTGAIVFPSSGPYSGPPTGLENPISMAIDHAGDVWVANGGTSNGSATFGIAEFSSTGALLLPADFGRIPGTIGAIAIDGVGHVIIAGQNTIVELNNNGSLINPYGYTDSSLNTINSIAVDGSGNVWAANYLGKSVTEFVGLAAPVVTPIAAGVANNTLGTRP
jgi:hypothetical protein